MSQVNYQICSNCIMDTSDPNITFDERGWCAYCRNYHENILPNWHTDDQGENELMRIAEKIKLKTEATKSVIIERLREDGLDQAIIHDKDLREIIEERTEIKLKKGEPVEKAIRRLKKKLDREQTLQQFRLRRRFEKPSAKRRRKEKAARFSAMLKARYADD